MDYIIGKIVDILQSQCMYFLQGSKRESIEKPSQHSFLENHIIITLSFFSNRFRLYRKKLLSCQ